MSLITKRQRDFIKDIEDVLEVEFEGKENRKGASDFIAKHVETFRVEKLKANKRFPPTGKQIRLIKDMEEVLDIKFKGRTVKTASKFIAKHLSEFQMEVNQYANNNPEFKFKRVRKIVHSRISKQIEEKKRKKNDREN